MPYPWGITEDKYGNIIVSDFISGLFKIDSKDQIIKLDQSTRWYPHPTHDSEYNVYLNNEQQLYALHNTKLYPYKNYKTKPAGENLSVYLYWSAYYDRLVSVQLGCISFWILSVNKERSSDGKIPHSGQFMDFVSLEMFTGIYGWVDHLV